MALKTLHSELLDRLTVRAQLLTAVSGITDIELIRPSQGHYLTVNYQFEDLTSLNNAYSVLFLSDSLPADISTFSWNSDDQAFGKIDAWHPHIVKVLRHELDKVAIYRNRVAFDTTLSRFKIHSKLYFPGQTIVSNTNPIFYSQSDTVKGSVNYYDYLNGRQNLNQSIRLFGSN